MAIKFVDIEYLRAQNASAGQLILAGQSNTLTYTQYVTVDVNGNVGIGTGVPVSTLTVQGNVQVLGDNSYFIFSDGSVQTSAANYTPSYGTDGTIQFAGTDGAFSGDSSNLVWDTANLRLGIGTSAPISTIQFNHTSLESVRTAWSTTATTVIDSFSVLIVRSAHYFVQVTDEDRSWYHTSQIMVVQDGITAYKSEYNEVVSVEKLGTFDCRVQSGQLQLLFTAFSATNKTVKITRTSMTA